MCIHLAAEIGKQPSFKEDYCIISDFNSKLSFKFILAFDLCLSKLSMLIVKFNSYQKARIVLEKSKPICNQPGIFQTYL